MYMVFVGAGSPTIIVNNRQSRKPAPTNTKNTNLHFPMRCKFQVDVGDRWWGAGLSRLLVFVRYYWWNPPLQNLGKGIVQKSLVFPAPKMYNISNMGSKK
jgi:hypothetical protein